MSVFEGGERGDTMVVGGSVSACLCVLSLSLSSPRFMASAANTAAHCAANMAYLLRTKEGPQLTQVIN